MALDTGQHSQFLQSFTNVNFDDPDLQALAVTVNPEPELMFEGQEKGSFWSDLGGAVEHTDQDDDGGGCREGGVLHRLGFPPGGRPL